MQPDCIMPTPSAPSSTAWTLPAGMRATTATRALAALYRARGWGDAQDIGDGDVRLHKARPAA